MASAAGTQGPESFEQAFDAFLDHVSGEMASNTRDHAGFEAGLARIESALVCEQSKAPATTPVAAAPTQVDEFEAKFKAALADIRRAKVKVRQNVPGASIGSIEPEALGLDAETERTTPYLFSYGGQGGRYTFRNGLPYYADLIKARRRWPIEAIRPSNGVKVIYFTHGGPATKAAGVAAAAFRAHGLDVVWDGTTLQSVMIRTPFFDPERDRV